ncbi:hypothetical protein ACFQJD_11605 [Haloplanus sp. GCM10025708]
MEDIDALRALLDAEESGENRDSVVTLVESRIDKLSESEVEGKSTRRN